MRRVMMLVGLLALAGCQDAPFQPTLEGPQFDQAATGQEPTFFWLPPLGTSYSGTGEFNPDVYPLVEVCEYSASDPCVAVLARFDRNATGTSELLSMDAVEEQYQANWKTRFAGWVRISVYGSLAQDAPLLGTIDVEIVPSGNVNSESTVPIKFRIDRTCTDCAETYLGPDEATVTLQGAAQLYLPPDPTRTSGYRLVIRQLPDPADYPCLPLQHPQYEGCYEVYLEDEAGQRVYGVSFTEPLTFHPCLDPKYWHIEDQLTVWKSTPAYSTDDGIVPEALIQLEKADRTAQGLDCTAFQPVLSSMNGTLGRALEAFGTALRPLAGLLLPRDAHATGTLQGYTIRDLSRIGFVGSSHEVTFLTPIGTVSKAANATVSPLPEVVVCRAPCNAPALQLFRGTTELKGGSYQINWSAPANLEPGPHYRIRVLWQDVVQDEVPITGVAGGTKTKEPFAFEIGRNLPIKFTLQPLPLP
jgi:hypothetical protein